jgi:FemAB-related protein (PEP-CTERM system-associated)
MLFGRYLVGLPYLNTGGVCANDENVAQRLIDAAIELAERLDVKFLELRHETPTRHSSLINRGPSKVHLRLDLPSDPESLWAGFSCKVRNQVRKGQKNGLRISWGKRELLPSFYEVFSRNMRDLGTPVYGRSFFHAIFDRFQAQAELCVVSRDRQPLAAGLLLHGKGVSEVPSASSLRSYNHTNANMLLYWQLLVRSVERAQKRFDFGRSTPGSNTYRFKRQWGATESPAAWQYYLRQGELNGMRPDHPKYSRLVRIWQRLPISVTRLIGPPIVRGIP